MSIYFLFFHNKIFVGFDQENVRQFINESTTFGPIYSPLWWGYEIEERRENTCACVWWGGGGGGECVCDGGGGAIYGGDGDDFTFFPLSPPL